MLNPYLVKIENEDGGSKNIYCKINEGEAGAIIDAIEKYTDWSAYHTYNDDKTTMSFKPVHFQH